MPVFGIGPWGMGGREERNPDNDDVRDITALRTAIDMGVTHIDTAEIYAAGRSEELVGEAVKSYDREKLFIVSKAASGHMRHNDLIRACEQSLTRLQMEYLDLYLLHRHDLDVDLEETINALNELVERGLIRNIGLSNFTTASHQEAATYAATPIVATQVHYNIQYREPEYDGLLAHCQENDCLLIAWRPLSKGEYAQRGVPVIDDLCETYGKTPAQIALNWLISQKNVVTLSKSSNLDHLTENLGAIGWEMKPEDIELIRTEYPSQREVSDVAPLA